MAFNFLGFLYARIFINIVVENLKSSVYVEVCSRKGIVKSSVKKSFDTLNSKAKMYEFIHSYKKESPFHYISILDQSASQGAVPTCKSSEISKYCNISAVKYLCYSKEFAVYTLESDLSAIRNEYKEIGVDLILSPFLILSEFFKDKIDSTLAMFLLIEENHISLAIFDNSKLLFAKYMDIGYLKDGAEMLLMGPSIEDENDDISLDMEEVDLSEINFDDDYASIESLDSSDDMDDMDEFSEEKEVKKVEEKKESGLVPDEFGEDYQRFLLIKDSLGVFYRDDKYDSKFVESIYIADSVGLSSDLKGYLEDEMFLSVYVRKIDLCEEICNMAKTELK